MAEESFYGNYTLQDEGLMHLDEAKNQQRMSYL